MSIPPEYDADPPKRYKKTHGKLGERGREGKEEKENRGPFSSSTLLPPFLSLLILVYVIMTSYAGNAKKNNI